MFKKNTILCQDCRITSLLYICIVIIIIVFRQQLFKQKKMSAETLQHLQKFYKITSNQYAKVTELLNKSKGDIESIQNLLEQYICCESINFETTPLKCFPDIKDKLTIKIMMELEEKFKKLHLTV